jgi:N-methylhydantoinase A
MDELDLDPSVIDAIYRELEAEALGVLERDRVPPERCHVVRHADVRYAGQAWEVRVDAPSGPIDAQATAEIVQRFHRAYERAYGYHYQGQQRVEVINFAVSGFGRIERPRLRAQLGNGAAMDPHTGMRPVWLASPAGTNGAAASPTVGGYVDTPVYSRAGLGADTHVNGPAIIEEFGSTTVVFPGQTVEVDANGVLIIRPRD